MGVTTQHFGSVDEDFAANLRRRREAEGLSQDELAQRMTERGFGFSQATVWKIEQGKRPVKISEMVALADALGVLRWHTLLDDPRRADHESRLERGHRKAAAAHRALQEATAAYLWAQAELAVSVRDARDDGVDVHLLWESYLDESAEKAVIAAHIAFEHEDDQGNLVAEQVDKVMTALRQIDIKPTIDPDDIVTLGPGGDPDDYPDDPGADAEAVGGEW